MVNGMALYCLISRTFLNEKARALAQQQQHRRCLLCSNSQTKPFAKPKPKAITLFISFHFTFFPFSRNKLLSREYFRMGITGLQS